MQEFEIKSYGFAELAGLYRPNLSSKNAMRTLKSWMTRTPGLLNELKATGFNPLQIRTLTPRQVAIIIRYLGEP